MKAKRILSFFMTFALVMTLLPTVAHAAGAPTISLGASVLATGVNTDNAATVGYGGNAWRVIGYGGNGAASIIYGATLLAAGNISQSKFNEKNLYEYSGSMLQTAVNTIANGISATEQAAVMPRKLTSGSYDGANTDCVAEAEVANAFLWPLSTKEAGEVAKTLRIVDSEHMDLSTNYWWLRSPGNYYDEAAVVGSEGYIYNYGHRVKYEYGVRPAFYLNLNSVLFISAAAGGKSSGSAAAGEIFGISTTDATNWKLTLRDSTGHGSFAVMDTTTVTAVAGETVELTYSGAATGANEYVSVLLCSADGNTVLGYGSGAALTSASSTSGTAAFTLPADLAPGTYKLKVFNEQKNGDNLSDYASGFWTVTLSIYPRETTPTATFTATGADCGELSGLVASDAYKISGAGLNATNVSADANGKYAVASGLTAGTLSVVKAGGWTTADSSAQEIAITKAATPTGLGKTDCTTEDNNNGTISGITASMEYKKSGASEWTAGTGDVISSLSNGTYYIRTKASGTTLASDDLELTIAECTFKITKAPAAITGLVYDGKAQALITAGEITGGTFYYALGTETEATEPYITSVPTATNAGTYYIWYKVRVDSSHNYLEPQSLGVTIAKASHDNVSLNASVGYGKSNSLDLTSYIEAGGGAGAITTEDTYGILSGEPSLDGNVLQFTAKNDANLIGKTAVISLPVENADNFDTYTISVTVEVAEKNSQILSFAAKEITLKAGETGTNAVSGAKTDVAYSSSDESIATVDENGEVTAISDGRAEITAEASETDEYYSASASFVVIVQEGKEEEKDEPEPEKKPDKVPFTEAGESYASSEDNFAAAAGSGKIKDQILDFSRVHESSVDLSGLKMTAISGSRFTTKAKLKDKNSIKATGSMKVKVNKKTLIPKITCKKSGSVTMTMEDDSTYTVNFTVEKPKAQKSSKKMSKGGTPVTKTLEELFGTHIDAGELSIVKQKHSQATVSDNSLIVNPAEKDSIKVQYKYLNKKYKMTIKVK